MYEARAVGDWIKQCNVLELSESTLCVSSCFWGDYIAIYTWLRLRPPQWKGWGCFVLFFLIVMSTNSNSELYRTNCELRRFFSYSLPSSGWSGLSGNARLLLVYVHCKSVARLVLWPLLTPKLCSNPAQNFSAFFSLGNNNSHKQKFARKNIIVRFHRLWTSLVRTANNV